MLLVIRAKIGFSSLFHTILLVNFASSSFTYSIRLICLLLPVTSESKVPVATKSSEDRKKAEKEMKERTARYVTHITTTLVFSRNNHILNCLLTIFYFARSCII